MRDLQDSMEREADIREQLKFAEEEVIYLVLITFFARATMKGFHFIYGTTNKKWAIIVIAVLFKLLQINTVYPLIIGFSLNIYLDQITIEKVKKEMVHFAWKSILSKTTNYGRKNIKFTGILSDGVL